MIIIHGNIHNIPPMTSNPGGYVNGQEESKIDIKAFNMAPLSIFSHIRSIYTICLKYVIIRLFYTVFFY